MSNRQVMRNKIKKHKSQLGPLETQFFSLIQLKNKKKIITGEISEFLSITRKQEWELLSRLTRSGFIIRLCRGLYLVPQKIPPGGKWCPSEYVIIYYLMDYYKANYQIGGPSAFNYYGLDNQIPNNIYIYNNRISGERKIGSMSFYFIEVPDKRLGGTKEIEIPDGQKIIMATLSRTLLDAIYDWPRFNTIPRAYEWIRSIKNKINIINELINLALKYGNQSVCRRLGYLLEQAEIKSNLINKLQQALTSSKSLIPWIPTNPGRGKINKKWGLIINE